MRKSRESVFFCDITKPYEKGTTMAKKEKGTHYSPRDTEQRSYYLPPGLGDAFKDFCLGNAGVGARGALILFMACRKFPDLRERAIRAADQMEIEEAVNVVEEALIEAVGNAAIRRWAESLPKCEKAKILADIKKRK